MYNNLLTLGPITIHGYGLMIGIGAALAILWAYYRAKSRGMNEDTVLNIAIAALVCGFLGAKILYIITDWNIFIKDPLSLLGTEGFVVYGGILAAIPAAWLVCRHGKQDFMPMLDVFMPPVALAQGFGRIGCFLAGCCFGKPTDSALGVIFPAGCAAPAGVPLWPTQLFSSGADFLLALILFLYDRRKHPSGSSCGLYLVLYSIGRFIIEYFRDDPRGAVGIFSTSQFISLFTLAAGILFLLWRKKADAPRAEDGENP